jgi:hypothetical protein
MGEQISIARNNWNSEQQEQLFGKNDGTILPLRDV